VPPDFGSQCLFVVLLRFCFSEPMRFVSSYKFSLSKAWLIFDFLPTIFARASVPRETYVTAGQPLGFLSKTSFLRDLIQPGLDLLSAGCTRPFAGFGSIVSVPLEGVSNLNFFGSLALAHHMFDEMHMR
jgi:hypothetical protein